MGYLSNSLAAALVLFLATVVLRRLRLRTCADLPVIARQEAIDRKPQVRLSVIIPARNEARNLPRLLQSLRAQTPPPFEIIVVDDDSTDDTAAVARAQGVRVLDSAALPPDWRGKTWACHQGAQAASGTHFLFLDADCWLADGGLATLLRHAPTHAGACSLLPDHRMQRPYEQGSAVFNLIMAWSVGALTPAGRPARRPGLFGQTLLIDRSSYERVGGHAAVRAAMLENLGLADRLRSLAVPLTVLGGRGVLCMRMYPDGPQAMTRGWAKTFAQGARQTPPSARCWIGWWISAGWIILGGLMATTATSGLRTYQHLAAWGGLYLAYANLSWLWLRRLGNYHWLTVLAYPVLLLYFLVVYTQSARIARGRSDAEWKDRRIRVTDEHT